MPIITTFVTRRPSEGTIAPAGVAASGKSPSRSRAIRIWPTISSGVRLRTSRWVPVWQKVQVRVQPTWQETQSVPRPSSGM